MNHRWRTAFGTISLLVAACGGLTTTGEDKGTGGAAGSAGAAGSGGGVSGGTGGTGVEPVSPPDCDPNGECFDGDGGYDDDGGYDGGAGGYAGGYDGDGGYDDDSGDYDGGVYVDGGEYDIDSGFYDDDGGFITPVTPDQPGTLPTSFSAADVKDAMARCAAPHGTVNPYTTLDQYETLLIGTWFACPKPDAPGTSIQFTGDGHFYDVGYENSPNAFQIEQGLDTSGTYQIIPPYASEYNNESYETTLAYANGSSEGTYFHFEKTPTRMEDSSGLTFYVPIPNR